MKRLLSIIFLVVIGITVTAQEVESVPHQMSLQAVVRDAQGTLFSYGDLNLQVDILKGSATGDVLYSEQQTVTTNSFGSFSTIVGTGDIDWGKGPYFMKVDISHPGGLQLAATYQLISVPYALNVHVTDSLRGVSFREKQVLSISHDTIFLTGGSFVVLHRFDGDYNHLTNRPTGNSHLANDAGYLTGEVQALSIAGRTVTLTGGSSVTIPIDFDGDYNHLTNTPTALSQFTNNAGFMLVEQQVLSISHDTIFLTGGSYVKIPRRAEIQTLDSVTALGNSAGDHQLKNLADPTDPQDALTYHYLDSLLMLLNIDPSLRGSHNVYVQEVCDGINWHGNWLTESGDYPYAYSNYLGYFSVDTLKLTVRHGSHSSSSIATNSTYIWHNTPYSQSGTYTYHYTNNEGCPSIDTLHLVISQHLDCTTYREFSDTLSLEACGVTVWYGRYIRLSGVYEQDLGYISSLGCDSIVRVNVIIHDRYMHDTVIRSTSPIVWRGHTYSAQGDYFDTVSHPGQCDSIYVLHLSMNNKAGIGAIPGLFSVANGLTVRFAKGNLQFYAAQNYWRFAPEQYECNYSPCQYAHYAAWADLFGWATSGWHNVSDPLCTQYHPWSLSNVSAQGGTDAYNYNLYGYGPSLNMTDVNLVASSLLYDWGQFNQISNGGNEDSLWRVPSREEWNYLLNERPNADILRFYGYMDSLPNRLANRYNEFATVYGLFFMADDWSCPADFYYQPAAPNANYNVVHPYQWKSLEASGMVFLPISYRYDDIRFYWSSSSGSSGGAYALSVGTEGNVVGPYNRSNSYFVRLIQNAVSGAMSCSCTTLDTVIVSNGPISFNGTTYTQSGEYVVVLPNSQGCDSIISLSFLIVEPGVLPGLFSVSDTHQVHFSKGNLQYHPKDDVWRFAPSQFDFKGTENDHLTQDFCGWVDLFPWGATGYHNPSDVRNTHYHPWDYGEPEGFGPSNNVADWDLINTSAHYDWGVHCPIANGGNTPGLWRTLSYDEWNYLLNLRPRADILRGFANIEGSNGMIILPDNWDFDTAPYSFYYNVYVENGRQYFDTNSYSLTQWAAMEAAGAVFLPCAGVHNSYENGFHYRWRGSYWSSSVFTQGFDEVWTPYAWILFFGYEEYSSNYFYNYPAFQSYQKSNRYSVRLVKD